MPAESKFYIGDYVQRVNQPELAGIIREFRWDGQVECWNYQVQFGAQLRASPKNPWKPLLSLKAFGIHLNAVTFRAKTFRVHSYIERLKNPPARIARSFAKTSTQF